LIEIAKSGFFRAAYLNGNRALVRDRPQLERTRRDSHVAAMMLGRLELFTVLVLLPPSSGAAERELFSLSTRKASRSRT
jgi:hypothetical protein